MATYVLRRLIQAIPILIGISVVSFAIINLAPGDPTDRFRSGRVSQETIQNLIRLYGLDKPLPEQFVSWFTAFWQFWKPEAWGYSFVDGRPVTEKIAEKIPTTLLLMGTSLFVTTIIAVPLGVLAAVKQYSWADKIITTLATIAYALPSFVLGILLLYIFAIKLNLFPSFGMQSLGQEGNVADVAWHMVLPVSSLALQQIAGWSRYMRSSMLEVLQQDYIRTARAKGLAGSRVLFKHALRNALIPVVTLLGLTLPSLLGGAAITESIFSWPGLGWLAVDSVGTNDYPVVLAIIMIGGVMVLLGNLLADVLYGLVDPRIKY
ncbi:MAG: diguanylate cyclase [Anaerolinea sp.]|jgi:peptide/nickel transport system permease protein|nr:diguanylate cyclase [Anaerolinea sp.]